MIEIVRDTFFRHMILFPFSQFVKPCDVPIFVTNIIL